MTRYIRSASNEVSRRQLRVYLTEVVGLGQLPYAARVVNQSPRNPGDQKARCGNLQAGDERQSQGMLQPP